MKRLIIPIISAAISMAAYAGERYPHGTITHETGFGSDAGMHCDEIYVDNMGDKAVVYINRFAYYDGGAPGIFDMATRCERLNKDNKLDLICTIKDDKKTDCVFLSKMSKEVADKYQSDFENVRDTYASLRQMK